MQGRLRPAVRALAVPGGAEQVPSMEQPSVHLQCCDGWLSGSAHLRARAWAQSCCGHGPGPAHSTI
jgi:hypothetical protein